jgi:hypothetical protein
MPAPAEQRCRYTHDGAGVTDVDSGPGAPIGSGAGPWRCPHYQFEPPDGPPNGYDYCPFHAGTERVADASALGEALLRIATNTPAREPAFRSLPTGLKTYVDRVRDGVLTAPERAQFLGATLGDVTFDHRSIGGPSMSPIDLRGVTVDGELSLRSASVERALWCDGGTVREGTDCSATTFERRAGFGGVQFGQRVTATDAQFDAAAEFRSARFAGAAAFGGATFGGVASFSDATVVGTADFRDTEFGNGLRGVGLRFEGAADFMAATFRAVANFTEAEFAAGAVFSSTDFEGNATFREVTFDGPTLLSQTSDYTSVDDRWDRIDVDGRTVRETAVVFRNVNCAGTLRVVDADVRGSVRVAATSLADETFVTGLTPLSESGAVVFDGVETVTGALAPGDDIQVTIRDTTVGAVELPPTAFGGMVLSDIRFDGFDFGAYKQVLADRGWRLHAAGDDTDPQMLENLYLRAKNGANSFGETRAAGGFFRWEMRFRRLAYATEARRALRARNVLSAGQACYQWVSNRLLQATCGYGEQPAKPVLFSAGMILVFALVYAVLGLRLPYTVPIGYLTFSIEAFVSLILGTPRTEGTLVNTVVAFEGFLGGFLIALFVFTLTRSISR